MTPEDMTIVINGHAYEFRQTTPPMGPPWFDVLRDGRKTAEVRNLTTAYGGVQWAISQPGAGGVRRTLTGPITLYEACEWLEQLHQKGHAL